MNTRLSGLAVGLVVMACEHTGTDVDPAQQQPPFEGSYDTPPIDLVVPESVDVAVFGLG